MCREIVFVMYQSNPDWYHITYIIKDIFGTLIQIISYGKLGLSFNDLLVNLNTPSSQTLALLNSFMIHT